MIQIKLLGGAKKSFSEDFITLDYDKLVLEQLLEILLEKKPADAPDLDIDNILVAINGVESSAMDGRNTIVNSGDTVSIIPVIHGGTPAVFGIQNTNAVILPVRGSQSMDYEFLNSLRRKFPKTVIQAVSSDFVLNESHVVKILLISLESKKRGILLSNKLETDILLRFAATTQISKAIADLGIKPNKDFVVIALGTKASLGKINAELSGMVDSKILLKKNPTRLVQYFKITQKQLDSISSETPMEDILQERASILF